jgi:hypothetical protein
MKNKNIIYLIMGVVALMFTITGCDDEDPVTLDARMETWQVTNIDSISAVAKGFVIAEGDGFTNYGVVYSATNTTPTTADTDVPADSIDNAVFKSLLTGLSHNTEYYVRAYVVDGAGETSYGESTSFTTTPARPTLYLDSIGAIESEQVTVYANIPYDGSGEVTGRGIVWNTDTIPSLEDDEDLGTTEVSADSGGDGIFSVEVTGLNPLTEYYIRAYATNVSGTTYSEVQTVETAEPNYPAELYMTGNGVGKADENWNWNEPLQLVPVNGYPNMFWKIVWMKGSGEFKFAPQPDWINDFGKTGDLNGDEYSFGGDNIPVPADSGFYMVVVDYNNSTIEITDAQVYGIGDPVFGGWNTYDANSLFTVDNANAQIRFDDVAADGELRMYVTSPNLEAQVGNDWWRAEFIFLSDGGAIEFRGNGGDQARFNVTAGDDVVLDFREGIGTLE